MAGVNKTMAAKKQATRGQKIFGWLLLIIIAIAVLAFLFSVKRNLDNIENELNQGASPKIDSTISPAEGFSGTWEGAATLTGNCANPSCKYIGSMNPPSVSLALQQNGNNAAGTITLNYPSSKVQTLISGMGCQAMSATGNIANGVISSTHISFEDPAGNVWSLNMIGSGLQGTVSNSQAGCIGLQGSVSLAKK
ncbi:MAG: hypothetical protein WC475_04170 [Candidatus Paceibacterota bacterium]